MIELPAHEHDDPAFLLLVRHIINGALDVFRPEEAYVVHIDNWFDHKWTVYYFWFAVPPFSPNRVLSQRHYRRVSDPCDWVWDGSGELLHRRRKGRPNLMPKLTTFARSAAFIWYSGNTHQNHRGSLMVYFSTPEGQTSWYASLRNAAEWKIERVRGITKSELRDFQHRGEQLEAADVGQGTSPFHILDQQSER